MPDPTIYTQSFDFSDFEETQPNTPKPGVQLDSQFQDVAAAIISHRDAIVDIRRSDGALKNKIVTADSLADGLLNELSSETGAAEAAASAAEAAASAASALLVANELEETLATLAASGGVSDWGSISDPPTVTSDWGAFP